MERPIRFAASAKIRQSDAVNPSSGVMRPAFRVRIGTDPLASASTRYGFGQLVQHPVEGDLLALHIRELERAPGTGSVAHANPGVHLCGGHSGHLAPAAIS